MINNSKNINKTHSHLKPLNIKRSTTYDVGNSCPGLGQAHICGRVKPVKGSQSSPPDNLIFNDNTDTNNDEQHSKTGILSQR